MLLIAIPGFAQSASVPKTAPAKEKVPSIVFRDVTRELGIKWQHTNGATPEKYLIETMGGGAAFLDYDRDGRLDIFLLNSGCHKFSRDKCVDTGSALYHQNANGSFTDVTQKSGIKVTTYGMGVAVGDYDNDGYPDIYVTGFDHNQLFHNNGDGSFTDVTAKAGVGAGGWSTSAAWFDYDHDGLPDLFVGRYLDWDYSKNIFCGDKRPQHRSYCHPNDFHGVTSRLYHNNGDGTFTDVTEKAGITEVGKALGVVAFDYNRDGWLDLYVANDAVRNFLYRNNGDGTFTEVGLQAEVAYGSGGKPRSGMGTDAADVNGTGWPEIFVTNIDYEPNTYFINNGDETFTDGTFTSNLASKPLLYSGFGTRYIDFNNDGLLDIVVANGHPLDNIDFFHDGVTYAERPFLIQNRGDHFEEVGLLHGDVFGKKYSGRGLAIGDFDNDGDTDVLLMQNGGPPVLMRNDGGNVNAWIGFELVGSSSGKDAIGSIVTVTVAGKKLSRELVGGASYCSAHDPRVLFGLGQLGKDIKIEKVEVRWPSGQMSSESGLAIRHYYKLTEPKARIIGKQNNSPALR